MACLSAAEAVMGVFLPQLNVLRVSASHIKTTVYYIQTGEATLKLDHKGVHFFICSVAVFGVQVKWDVTIFLNWRQENLKLE